MSTYRHFFRFAFAAGVALAAIPLAAQVSERPQVPGQPTPGIQTARPGQPRDRGRLQQQTGTAAISGRVTAAETGLPIRRAQVRIMAPELRGSRNTMTDAEGRFTVGGLPAGRYNIMFTKSGFVQAQYGQKRPNQPGRSIELAEGQKIDRVDAALMRGGVIAGRVFDEYGEPVVDARVQVMQHRWVNGRRRLVNMGRMGQSNDRGEFRVWGLPSGDFFVSAVATERQMFMDAASAANDTSESTGYAPTYYPGTAISEEAQRVTLTPGQEVGGIDFQLVTTRTVRVSGTALLSDGRPMSNANVMLFARAAIEGGMMSPQGGSTDASGGFTIPGVTPGEYILQARVNPGRDRGAADMEIAAMPLNVGGDDMKNVMLVASRGVRVSGRITFDAPAPPGALENLRVFFPPAENEFMMMGGAGSGEVTAQGTFEVRGVFGKRRVALSGLPAGWALKAVRIGGADVVDTGYEFAKENVTNVEFVVTNQVSSLNGTVAAGEDSPVADYVVVAFSTDEAAWQQGSRRLGIARPDQKGTYSFRGLPPGSYYVLALDSMPEEWGNPELFERLKSGATRVTLAEGESETLNLKLQAAPIS